MEDNPETVGKKFFTDFSDDVFKDIKDSNIKTLHKKLFKDLVETKEFVKTYRETVKDDVMRIRMLGQKDKLLKAIQLHLNISYSLLTSMKKNKKMNDRLTLEQDILEGEEQKIVYERLQNWILSKEPVDYIYRILCIMSLNGNGIDPLIYDAIKKEIIETYGYGQMLMFSKLEKRGFIRKEDKKRKKDDKGLYERLRKPLGLQREFPEGTDPSLINLPYDNYVPLSYKLFEMAILEGWRNLPIMNSIPGPMRIIGNPDCALSNTQVKKTILVYMIGGITYAEVSYMRKLATQANIELLVATTDIINSKDIFKPFLDQVGSA